MLKVLLVDDEPIMLEGLRFMVDWNRLGFEVCGTARDGEDALELIHQLQPHLVITDIRMPVIDGLELIQRVSSIGFWTKFIVVSGYSDFEYAKRAIQYGVSSYLTKPLEEPELEREIELAARRIRNELTTQKDQNNKFKYVKMEMMSRLLLTRSDEVASGLQEQLLELDEETMFHCVIVNRVDDPFVEISEESVDYYDACTAALFGYASVCRIYPFSIARFCYGFILTSRTDSFRILTESLEAFAEQSGSHFAQPLSLAVSRTHTGIRQLQSAYMEALAAWLDDPVSACNRIRYFEDDHRRHVDLVPDPLRRTLLQSVESGQIESISPSIHRLFIFFCSRIGTTVWIEAFLANLKLELLAPISRMGGNPGDWEKKWCTARASVSLDELKAQTIQELEEAAAWFANRRECMKDSIVMEAMDYIRKHYRGKLKLQDVAGSLHVNPAYLGQRLKSQLGMSFHEFLHSLRIEEAKKLLRRTDLNICDVAQRVGYSDAEYFTEKFKAYNGMSPSVYKKG
ncbi:response regulator [Paenibacillus sp. JX-17]|uniref:Response regulator n=1 Tax=Paenibacillus lacisoli TaxID=3064525 RepID=A0ABT9CME4_9BACL|nr:response regulator [Paenibacillus sp. JX-17]MDO7908773.1 response regulator [Paenibacillus sp. JX-17]